MLNAKLITDNAITLVIDGKTYSVTRGHPNWGLIVKTLKEKRYDDLLSIINPKTVVKSLGKGFAVDDQDRVTLMGKPINEALSKVLIALIREGHDVTAYLNFQNKLEDNPSYKAREQLFRFIEANKITITEDGDLLLYKNVNRRADGSFVDVYTGRIDNSVGRTVMMDRSKVDDDPNNTCSKGLHVASLPYLQHYPGSVTVLVKVNPANVVSIPTDYNNSKMRVCEYEVFAVHDKGVHEEATTSSLYGYDSNGCVYSSNNDADYFDDGDVQSI